MSQRPTILIAAALLAAACGQDEVTLPDQDGGGAGACGAWYPGGDAQGDAGVDYAFNVGEIIPCFVWESVRGGAEGDEYDTYINMGELYLQHEHGAVDEIREKYSDGVQDPKAVVLAISAENCAACAAFIASLDAWREDLEAAGAVLIGVARSDVSESNWLDLDGADELLLSEGWPDDLLRTNDAERHLGTLGNIYPMTAIIDLETMTLLALDSGQLFFDGEAIHEYLVQQYD